MKEKLIPLYNRVLVQKTEKKDISFGGIIIPDSVKSDTQRGVIKAIGKGKLTENGTFVPMLVKVGDNIVFGKFSGTEIKLSGQKYLIIREEEILVIID